MAKRKKESTPASARKGKRILLILLTIVLVIFLHFKIEDIFLKYYGHCSQGIIINTIQYHRGAKPSYRFSFIENEKYFEGDSRIEERSAIGDTIPIVYLKIFPYINRSIDGYFKGDFECPKRKQSTP